MKFNIFKKQKTNDEMVLVCPRCGVIMKKINKEEVVIDVCNKCRGMWLDDNEIEKLIHKARGKKNGKKDRT